MSKLDSIPPTLTVSPASFPDLETGRRLVVLIPDVESDYTPAIQKIWELAHSLGGRVQFLGLCRDAAEEPSLRRELVTLSALVQNGGVSAEARVAFGADWVKAVRSDRQPGDAIVCFSQQRVGLFQRPLSQILASDLDSPLYILSDLYPLEQSTSSNWLSQALAWLGSFGIILGFLWLQIRIDQLAKDWAHSALIALSIPIEIGLIVGWNLLIG